MLTGITGENAAVFNYGFLSIKTSKLLTDVERGTSSFTTDDYKTLEKAESFLKKIIDGQKLMSGEKEIGFIPTSDSVEAVSYALNILGILQNKNLITKVKELSEIKLIFQDIHDVLLKISEQKIENIPDEQLKLSLNFFHWLSHTLLTEAQKAAKLHPHR